VRVVRSVEGVVDVHSLLSGPRRRPPLDPDFADDAERPGERDGTGGAPEKAGAACTRPPAGGHAQGLRVSRTTTTGPAACWAQRWLTEPSMVRAKPPRPR